MDEPLLVFRQVTKKFRRRSGFFGSQELVAVDRADLSVGPAGLVCLVGPSGSGKSTLARLMVGLTAPTSGSVVFEGVELTADPLNRRFAGRRQIVFQNPYRSLSPRLAVRDIITEPAQIIGFEAKPETLCEAVGLPHGLLDRYPHQLSAGERQRVALARALSTSPRLLVLDEPTSSLDPPAAAAINRLVHRLTENMAVVLITHDRNMLKEADRILAMTSGRPTPAKEELLIELGLISSFYGADRYKD